MYSFFAAILYHIVRIFRSWLKKWTKNSLLCTHTHRPSTKMYVFFFAWIWNHTSFAHLNGEKRRVVLSEWSKRAEEQQTEKWNPVSSRRDIECSEAMMMRELTLVRTNSIRHTNMCKCKHYSTLFHRVRGSIGKFAMCLAVLNCSKTGNCKSDTQSNRIELLLTTNDDDDNGNGHGNDDDDEKYCHRSSISW